MTSQTCEWDKTLVPEVGIGLAGTLFRTGPLEGIDTRLFVVDVCRFLSENTTTRFTVFPIFFMCLHPWNIGLWSTNTMFFMIKNLTEIQLYCVTYLCVPQKNGECVYRVYGSYLTAQRGMSETNQWSAHHCPWEHDTRGLSFLLRPDAVSKTSPDHNETRYDRSSKQLIHPTGGHISIIASRWPRSPGLSVGASVDLQHTENNTDWPSEDRHWSNPQGPPDPASARPLGPTVRNAQCIIHRGSEVVTQSIQSVKTIPRRQWRGEKYYPVMWLTHTLDNSIRCRCAEKWN